MPAKLVRPLANQAERSAHLAETTAREALPEMPLSADDLRDPFVDHPVPQVRGSAPAKTPIIPPDFKPDPPQPTNSKRETEWRRFDRTQLREGGYGYSVHRDYAAHFFRWGFAKKFVEQGMFVLDVGCGQDQPLARVLAAGVAQNIPAVMVGVDYNKIAKPFHVNWLVTLDEFDFTTRYAETLEHLPKSPKFESLFDLAVCLEVIEHMHTCDGARLLEAIREVIKPSGGRLIISTPVFNGRAAANHIHEYTVPELQAALEAAGWEVERRFGTFASYPELKPALSVAQLEDLQRLREFYDNDVAACFYAPLFPDHSRNNCWVCKVRS